MDSLAILNALKLIDQETIFDNRMLDDLRKASTLLDVDTDLAGDISEEKKNKNAQKLFLTLQSPLRLNHIYQEHVHNNRIDGETISVIVQVITPLLGLIFTFLFGFKIIPNFFRDDNYDALFSAVGAAISFVVTGIVLIIAKIINGKKRDYYYEAMKAKRYNPSKVKRTEEGKRSNSLKNAQTNINIYTEGENNKTIVQETKRKIVNKIRF